MFSSPCAVSSRLALMLALLWLAGCGSAPRAPAPPAVPAPGALQESDAELFLQSGDVLAAAAVYTELARTADSPQREDLLLRAADLLVDDQRYDLAAERLQALASRDLNLAQRTRYGVLRSRIAIGEGRAREALALIPPEQPEMTLSERAALLELRAQALSLLEQTVDAVRARIALEPMLESIEAIERNHAQLWQLLGQPALLDLAAYRQLNHGEVFRGWVELAEAVRGARLEQGSLAAAVNGWVQRYPAHPAADSFANNLLDSILADRAYPHQIALLLPLSGPLAPVAQAIRDGFMTAYFEATDDGSKPEVRVYDAGDEPGEFWESYNRALAEGAKLVVGPLSKASVNVLAAAGTLPAPVLSLNYADANVVAPPPGLYQFGLLPEDEARQSAEFIIESGLPRAAAIVPAGAWGQRLLSAFQETLERFGGKLVDHEVYAAEKNDFSGPIQRVLSLQLSDSRHRVLQRSLGRRLEFEPRRREDVDVIFLAAAPKNARLLKPQLSFHHASDVPVYATSHVYSGAVDARADKDMDGLIYLDIPLILDGDAQTRSLRTRLQQNWPQSTQRYLRLFALGMDAYTLIPQLEKLRDNPDLRLAGWTGELSMDIGQRVHRRLRWGYFEGGEPQPLALPDAELAAQQLPE